MYVLSMILCRTPRILSLVGRSARATEEQRGENGRLTRSLTRLKEFPEALVLCFDYSNLWYVHNNNNNNNM
jgi:hypothetical protein